MTSGGSQHRRASGALHRIGETSADAGMAVSVGTMVVLWLAIYAARGFPAWMATALEVVAASTTLVMVFVIQHTQRRREDATQLKLDELVRSSDADDSVAEIEADSDELDRRRTRHA